MNAENSDSELVAADRHPSLLQIRGIDDSSELIAQILLVNGTALVEKSVNRFSRPGG